MQEDKDWRPKSYRKLRSRGMRAGAISLGLAIMRSLAPHHESEMVKAG